jgi:flagellar biosynthesis protein FlhA
VLDPMTVHKVLGSAREQAQRMASLGYQPVVLVSPRIRIHFRRLAERMVSSLAVMSYNELSSGAKLETVGMVSMTDESTADQIPQYA